MGTWKQYCQTFYGNEDCRKERTMSLEFDSMKDLLKHFETHPGSSNPEFSHPIDDGEELWFREVSGWDAKKARAYLTAQGYEGDLIRNDGGWFFSQRWRMVLQYVRR